jgi:hypothetical protein
MISDVADKFMQEGDYKRMANARPNNTNSKSGGVVENIPSNLPISTISFGESVEYIGGCQDNKRQAIISLYRGTTTLFITSYDVNTKQESFVLKNTAIDASKRVTHAGVLDDYLFWIDGESKLRKFNLNNATSDVNVPVADHLLIDKAPPLFPPGVVASVDNGHVSNNIQNLILQYTYSYVYNDGEKSSWSPISKSILPIPEDDSDQVFPNNKHTITLATGGTNVEKILIAVRKGESRDFLLVDTLDKEDEGISDNTTYDYSFYNDKATTGLDQDDVLAYTFNPYFRFSTMAISNDNFLAMGGVEDGLENTDISLSVSMNVEGIPTSREAGFKTGAIHEFGLLFRDTNGRTAGVCATTQLYIPSIVKLYLLGETTLVGNYITVDWEVTGSAPDWAETMSIVYLGNKSISYFVDHVVGDIYNRFGYTYIDISPLNLASQAGSTTEIEAKEINIEPYTWVKGDRIRFITNDEGGFVTSELDLEIRGYVPEVTDTQGNILYSNTIYTDEFDISVDPIGRYSQYEIYRPRTEYNDEIFFEIAEVFDVINGAPQVVSGNINSGDVYKRNRSYDTREIGDIASDIDWSFSEYQESNVTPELSATGGVDGLSNQTSDVPFFKAPIDSTITTTGTFSYEAEWREGYTSPYPIFYIERPGSNNNETIDIPYTFTSQSSSNSDLDAGKFEGIIDYSGIDMPEGSKIWMRFRVIGKHRVIIKEGVNIAFRVLVEDEEDQFIDFWVEDKNYSDYFASDEHSKGRPFTEIKDDIKTGVRNNIVTTGKYFADTNIDETNRIDTSSITYIPYHHGSITALRVIGNTLKALTPSKEIRMYLGREQYVDGSGNVQTSLSSNKLGAISVSNTDYGTSNPESLLIDSRSMYYFDRKNAAIVSSHVNGQNDIGDYGFKTRIREITSRINAATAYEVHIGFNDKNDEVICSFIYDGTQETVVFNERDNVWTHELEQTDGSNPVEGMCHLGENLLCYLGKPYLNEGGADNLNFFGYAKTAVIEAVINANPINTKVLQTMSYQSSDAWDIDIETEAMYEFPNGMYTQIPTGRQVIQEGIYFTDIPNNIRSKSGSISRLLYATGTPLRARTATISMSNSNTSTVKLDEVTVNYVPSSVQ